MTKSAAPDQASGADERELFIRIFDAEYEYVYHSLRRLGVHERDVEDVVHDVFVTVFNSLARYDAARPIRPWLFAFAFRMAADYRRLARHRTELGVEPEAVVSSAPSAEESAMQRDATRILNAALSTLPIEQRAVFIMYEIDETSMKEIAETLAVPLNTAYSRLRLARAAFTEAVATERAKGRRES